MIYKLIGILIINFLITFKAAAQEQKFLESKYDEAALKMTKLNMPLRLNVQHQ